MFACDCEGLCDFGMSHVTGGVGCGDGFVIFVGIQGDLDGLFGGTLEDGCQDGDDQVESGIVVVVDDDVVVGGRGGFLLLGGLDGVEGLAHRGTCAGGEVDLG